MTEALKPVQDMIEKRRPLFSGESSAYRDARRALLAEEIELRRHATRVVEQRRSLPPGPVIEKSYVFEDANGKRLRLVDLFGEHHTLVTYFWMFGPQREQPCPMCTNWLGSVDGNARDIEQRAALRILGRSPVSRQLDFARSRGWSNLQFVQTVGDEYANDLSLLDEKGAESPALAVFRREGDVVRLYWASEMNEDMADPGQDPRDYPDIASLWAVLDLTPEGRAKDWYPKLSY